VEWKSSIGNFTLGQRALELEVKKKAQTAQSFGDDPLPLDCSSIYSDCEPMIFA
jgi:hypothetical protein